MPITRINEFGDVARIFKGKFVLYHNANNTTDGYVFDQLVELSATANQLTSPHYGTRGKKKLAVIGYESAYTVRVDDTADLYPENDVVNVGATPLTAEEKVSVSYFLNRMANNDLVPAHFSSVEESDSTSPEKWIVNEFSGFITGAEHVRNTGTGTFEREYTFDVIDVTQTIRTAADPSPVP